MTPSLRRIALCVAIAVAATAVLTVQSSASSETDAGKALFEAAPARVVPSAPVAGSTAAEPIDLVPAPDAASPCHSTTGAGLRATAEKDWNLGGPCQATGSCASAAG